MTWIGGPAGADEVHDTVEKSTSKVDIKLDVYLPMDRGPIPAAVLVEVNGPVKRTEMLE